MLRYTNNVFNAFSPEQIREYQERRLRGQIEYVYGNSSYYRNAMDAAGAAPGDINGLDDFFKLPVLIDKERERLSQRESQERHGHPFGMHLCAPLDDIVMTATTSGTSGEPTFTYTLTDKDVDDIVPSVAMLIGQAGIGAGDRMLFSYALGIYATTAVLLPLRRAGVLPIDVDVRAGTESILSYAAITRPSGAWTTPSLAQHLVHRARELGQDVADLNLRGLFFTGEPGVGIPAVKSFLEESYGCRVYDVSSPAGNGLAISCDSDQYYGMHVVSPELDLYPLDLIDPETKEHVPVEDGAEGEAVYTALHRRARPLMRYATGDVIRVATGPCPGCGFDGLRVFLVGRSDDMLIVKGVNVFPSALKAIISEFSPEEVTGEMRIVLTSPPPRVEPPLSVKLEFAEHVRGDDLPGIEERIARRLHTRLRVTPRFEWVPPGTLERSVRKTPLFEERYS